jgi:hypothetical protein
MVMTVLSQNRLNLIYYVVLYYYDNIVVIFLKNQQSDIFEDTIKLFCMEPRRVQFLFDDNDQWVIIIYY